LILEAFVAIKITSLLEEELATTTLSGDGTSP
jgi:hypothetical protein